MTHLKEGDKAPHFKGIDQNNKEISLSDFRGKKVILYFYPKDMTPGCTTQACDYRDNYNDLLKKGYQVIGVSADDASRHTKFIEKYDLPFPLIADTEKEIIKQYGVWGLKKFMGKEYDGIHRQTFVINEEGVIGKVIKKVKTKEATAQTLEK